jgi:hypothetical protein
LSQRTQPPNRAAAFSAANRAIDSAKSKAVSDSAKATGFKASDVRDKIRTYKANKSLPAALLRALNKGLSLALFKPKVKAVRTTRGKRYGVTVSEGKNRYLVPGAFLAKGKNGKPLVLARKSRSRYPLVALKSDGLFKFLSSVGYLNALTDHARKVFETRMKHELNRRGLDGNGD